MTEKVKESLAFLLDRSYRENRDQTEIDMRAETENLSLDERRVLIFQRAMQEEKPVFYPNDIFGFNRYRRYLPNAGFWCGFGNLTLDFATYLQKGFAGIKEEMQSRWANADERARTFYGYFFRYYDACMVVLEKYKRAAIKENNTRFAAALAQVPLRGARDYYEALVSLRFLHYVLRFEHPHITIGRFDQYMFPYAQASLHSGATLDEILELTELFFIALNYDADIYFGVQQGDNGQSIILGGCDRAGNDAYNFLTEICLQASEELKLIDPKVNLRVNKNTPLSLYERATRLTRQGLGFPQYCNDDIVIDGLVALGYDLADARDYTVAACWEFIPSACGADWPNVDKMNFPKVVRDATTLRLQDCQNYEQFRNAVVRAECDALFNKIKEYAWSYEPFLSAFISPCIEVGRDISDYGAKYQNFGVHGAGIANAADAMWAVKIAVFDEKFVTARELQEALEKNFEGFEDLQKRLLALPKMGNNNAVDEEAGFLMEQFSLGLNGRKYKNGIFRAGTGSAHEYIYSSKIVGATADGRKAFEPYGSSFSPAITTKLDGPLSTILSFTKFDLRKIINGGPLTMELHDTVFRNDEGVKKVAMLVKAFIDRGGHQLQLNAVNRETLLDAQAHPEKYPNLIVRVWGWSGYFNELDKVFQDHVIARTEFTV